MRENQHSRVWRRATVGALAAVVAATGCEVTNPGPVQDEFLSLPASHAGLVNGAGRRLAEAIGETGYTVMIVAREVMPGGQTGSYGWNVTQQGGYLEPGAEGGLGNEFQDSQQALFIAEEALRRFADPDVNAAAAEITRAHLYAGFALRNLGENWCEAVLDGEGIVDTDEYFSRAEQHFTDALTTATGDMATAARAGRAQVRVWLGDWSGAVSDASQIPTDFAYTINFDNVDANTRNYFYWGSANIPYRSYTVWNTFYEDYYAETGDPRTPWGTLQGIDYSTGALSGYGQVPFIQQRKYTSPNDDVRLASGREMRLIEAEAELVAGNWQNAVTIINNLRAGIESDLTEAPLGPVSASNAAQAWTALMRERGIELWLEARRMGDLRRWQDAGVPGDRNLPDFESVSELFTEHARSQCFDIPDVERDSNPNVPPAAQG